MKRLGCLIWGIMVGIMAYGQNFSEVVAEPNTSAEILYGRAEKWFALSNFTHVSNFEIEKTVIVGEGLFELVSGLDLYFLFTLEVKDGRYKYTFETQKIKGLETSYTYSQLCQWADEYRLKDVNQIVEENKKFYRGPYKKELIANLEEKRSRFMNIPVEIDEKINRFIAGMKKSLKADESKW